MKTKKQKVKKEKAPIKKKGKKWAQITWTPKKVLVSKVVPTPNNFKIKTELGQERLQKSLELFGLAGTTVVNIGKGGSYPLIDGNSRREEAIEKKKTHMWVSIPSRPLSPKEFKEMAAMYDYAKAGEVDMDRIKGELGKTQDFFHKWGLQVPMALLEKLGNNASIDELEYPDKKGKGKKGKDVAAVGDIKMVNLFFTEKQEEEFRKMEEKLKKKFKTSTTTDTVYKALKSIK